MTEKLNIELTTEMRKALDEGENIEESSVAKDFEDLFRTLDAIKGKKVLLNEELKEFIGRGDKDPVEDYGTFMGYTYCHVIIKGSNGKVVSTPFLNRLTLEVVPETG